MYVSGSPEYLSLERVLHFFLFLPKDNIKKKKKGLHAMQPKGKRKGKEKEVKEVTTLTTY